MAKTHQSRTPARTAAPVRPAPAVARTPTRPHQAQQQAVGNQALQQLLDAHAVQAKLTVTPPTDAYEQEAERVADEVMHASRPTTEAATPGVSAGAVSRAAKADSKDDKKKPPESKKKDDDKVKREAAKKPEDDKKVKREAMPETKEDDDEKVQRAADGSAVPEVSPEVERAVDRQAGGGQPLPAELRSFYEPRFGADLGNVRLHTDTEAAAAAKDLKAEAFTRGSDVYFAAGRYQPQSDRGRHLIAHELTHTLQQSGAGPVQTKRAAGGNGPLAAPAAVVQRDNGDAGGDAATATAEDPAAGIADQATKTITFPKVEVPTFKTQAHRATKYAGELVRKRAYKRGNTAQRDVWKQKVKSETIATKLGALWQQNTQTPPTGTILFSGPGGKNRPDKYFVGDLNTVAQEMTLPSWTKSGAPKSYDVDHILELQLANWTGSGGANDLPNMELLDAGKNRSSGATISADIDKRVADFNKKNNKDKKYGKGEADLKENYDLKFSAAEAKGETVTEEDFWTPEQVERGEHITDKVRVVKNEELGGDGTVVILPQGAGYKKTFKWPGGFASGEADWLKPFRLTAKQFNTDSADDANFGTLTYELPADSETWASDAGPQTIPVARLPGARYAGTMDKQAVRRQLRLRHKKLSPVQVDAFDILPSGGLSVTGQILLDTPVLRGASVDFELTGNELILSKQFTTTDFSLPKPFVARSCSLTLFASTAGRIGAEGQLDFAIEKVGEGYLKALARLDQGFGLEGKFAFDRRVFDPAEFTLRYIDGKFSGEGTVGIPDGKLKGVKSATVTVSYADEVLRATGSAELKIPGVKSAAVSVTYGEEVGLTIKGNVSLADGIPGIRGGSAEAEVKQSPAGDWAVTAKGTATPAIPGIDSTLDIAYDNGAITIQGHAAVNRGMLKGELTLGATNRAVDDQGNPAGEPGERLVAFGSGSATITFTPWLAATAGIRILPNGELEVSGRIGLPSSVDVFPEKKVEKSIFSLGLDIPIVGVAVAGQRIGIFATIRGGLDASAGFGPGQLRNLFAEVTYNPDHEEQTTIHGHGEFHVPAHAGLRLFVRGGLGVGIPIVSATANLEVGGQLGIEGAADAMVDVNWTPQTGLELDATASLSAQPKFKLDVTGLVLVEADLLLTTITLYEKRWQLAAVEFGSDMTFGLTFPIHYKSGQPFDVKLEDVQFQLPEIDPGSMLRDLFAKIA